ncbi:hypothetical protein APHAL10511_007328 [Amanita phalloides]|nr:hypothetical protein APHAL10511_007328 [Amanita phalloides]
MMSLPLYKPPLFLTPFYLSTCAMTRTERASYPRAVLRDRSLSRSGLNTHLRKGGAGRHNWGGIEHESRLEYQALDDEERELERLPEDEIPNTAKTEDKKPGLSRTTSSMSDEERRRAMNIRKNALKKDIDLATIARTSTAVLSPLPDHGTSGITTPSSV